MSVFDTMFKSAPLIVQTKLNELKSLRERPDYHPEPSTYHHIKIVVDRLAQTKDIDLIMAGMLHDICKLDCARLNPKTGYPSSPGHDTAAYQFITQTPEVIDWIRANGADDVKVAAICLNHMKIHMINEMRPAKRDSYIQKWKDMGIWDKLRVHDAADNMLSDFNYEMYCGGGSLNSQG